jgi:putative polyketide hydroxylase
LLDWEELTGLPGTRVPHVWLERKSQRISTLDLFDGGFVLLTGSEGTTWRKAAVHAATFLGIKLAAYWIGPEGDLFDPENQWAQKMGVSSEGTVLIRPDSFVAWRNGHRSIRPEQKLHEVLNHILCRSTNR